MVWRYDIFLLIKKDNLNCKVGVSLYFSSKRSVSKQPIGQPILAVSISSGNRSSLIVSVTLTECKYKYFYSLSNYVIKSMTQFQALLQLDVQSTPHPKDRFRTMQVRIKKHKSQLQDYDMKENIGQGGFGRVRKATHRPTGETVAVKILRVDECEPQQVQSVEGEILLQQRLLHQNIAQIYEVIRRDNKIYIFMEYCSNGQLFSHIVNNGPMGEREAARVCQQILAALLYLKKMGISHRDIKPENILFDRHWNVKLVDFGFSCKSLTEDGHFRRTVCGTPSYTPPQVILKQTYNPQLMDVWSLGVTLYAMLAGQLPFEGDSNDKRKSRIINYRWSVKHFFSQKVSKLLSSIFVEASRRISLEELSNTEFMSSFSFSSANCVDYKNEVLVPEEAILGLAERECRVERRKVAESVKAYRLDKYRAIYYLLLRRQLQLKTAEFADISPYRRQRKNSIMKLEPILRTPLQKQKVLQVPKLKLEVGSGRARTLEINSCRLRREATIDSPRRLLDCLGVYKGF